MYSNNPNAVYNGLISGQRNMFLSSSLAVVMIGFSNSFSDPVTQWLIKALAAFIFFVAIYIGMAASSDFLFYMDANKNKLPSDVPENQWRRWVYVSYVYSAIILVVAIVMFRDKIIISIPKRGA